MSKAKEYFQDLLREKFSNNQDNLNTFLDENDLNVCDKCDILKPRTELHQITENETKLINDYDFLCDKCYPILKRLNYLRQEIEKECISQSEIAELQGLADHIDKGDTLLLEWVLVPEFNQ